MKVVTLSEAISLIHSGDKVGISVQSALYIVSTVG